MKYALPTILLGMVLFTGCPPKEVVQEEKPAIVETQTVGNLRKEAIDLNNDNVPDIWNYYATEGRRKLVMKETDLNFDGRRDIISHYEDGKLAKEEVDADFDGHIDWTDFYGDDGKRIRQEVDTDFDGKVDVWKYFHDGKIIRKERDTNNDGRPDYFEHYENGEVTRIGRDTDGDGREDVWDQVDLRATPPPESP